jgi:putative FmdB family regulatory protein
MPIYEYACKYCGEIVEGFFNLSDRAPMCHGGEMRRIPSQFSYKVKGVYARKKEQPTNSLELDQLLSGHGEAPVFPSSEVKEKAEWAVKKGRMGDTDLKL